MSTLSPVAAANARFARIERAEQAVIEASCGYRAAVADWKAADDKVDGLQRPATPAQKRAWQAAFRACTAADERMWAAELALFRAVERLERAKAGR